MENYIYTHANQNLKKYLCPVIWYKDDIYKSVQELVKTFDLLYGDVKSLSSWGTLNEQPVLIDYGCTREIFRKYFK